MSGRQYGVQQNHKKATVRTPMLSAAFSDGLQLTEPFSDHESNFRQLVVWTRPHVCAKVTAWWASEVNLDAKGTWEEIGRDCRSQGDKLVHDCNSSRTSTTYSEPSNYRYMVSALSSYCGLRTIWSRRGCNRRPHRCCDGSVSIING